MKKILSSLVISTALFGSVCAAQEVGTSYVGAKFGAGHLEDHSGRNAYGVKIDEHTDFAYGAYVGYNFSDFFGLELGYDYFGEFAYKGNFDGKNLGKTKVHGAELAALVAVPLSSSGSDVFLKFGGLYSNVNDNVFDKTASQVSPLLGIGSRLSFEDIQLRLEYIWSHKIMKKEDFGYAPDLSMVSLGLEYKFGGNAPVAEPVKEVAPEPVKEVVKQKKIVKNNITLNAKALFKTNSAKLSAEGKRSVTEAISEIKKNNLEDVQIEVAGHTDRTGSEKYNMDLSKKRARAVVEEFVAQGVEPNTIQAKGYGETQSVVGNACDNIKNKKKLNDCLAPDRRVEVIFTGVEKKEIIE